MNSSWKIKYMFKFAMNSSPILHILFTIINTNKIKLVFKTVRNKDFFKHVPFIAGNLKQFKKS